MSVTNALTIDVEDYFHVEAFAAVIPPSDWDRYPRRVERNTYRLLGHLSHRRIRATFFILGWVAERCRGLVQAIVKAGHEIGSHGYGHQMICRNDERAFRADVYRSKAILEDQTGSPVDCYRAASYSITAETLWALDALADMGFKYDSSIYPVYHDYYGLPSAPRFPHFRPLSGGKRILEFPPSTLRAFGVNLPIGGGGYFRLFPYCVTSRAIRRLNETERQPALLYFHPWEFDPEQPRIKAPWRSRLRHYQNLGSAEDKLQRLLDQFAWAPMGEVLQATLKSTRITGEVDDGL